MKVSKKMLEEAKKKSAETGKEIVLGLPFFADQRQAAQMYMPTGGAKKISRKMMEGMNIAVRVFPDGTVWD